MTKYITRCNISIVREKKKTYQEIGKEKKMKKMNEVKARDFGKFHSEEWVTYKKATIRITFDYLNGRWYYGSETHSISGVFYGNFADLKKQIKSDYKKNVEM